MPEREHHDIKPEDWFGDTPALRRRIEPKSDAAVWALPIAAAIFGASLIGAAYLLRPDRQPYEFMNQGRHVFVGNRSTGDIALCHAPGDSQITCSIEDSATDAVMRSMMSAAEAAVQ